MSFYERILRPLLFRLDAETAHNLALRLLACSPPALLRLLFPPPARRQPLSAFGLLFPHPVGLAAGMDKAAVALPAWEALGFGFVEVGTVTALPQPGNPKPRVFRVPARRALVNRMGFNNPGAAAVAQRLRALRAARRWPAIPVGINIGKSRATALDEAAKDYLVSFRELAPLADYVVVNVSSPNTPGLRELQELSRLRRILEALRQHDPAKPLLLKIAPDLPEEQLADIAGLAEGMGAAGLIATNTTLDASLLSGEWAGQGGISGMPLEARAEAVAAFLKTTTRLPVVASGGLMDGASAARRWKTGASLLQIYTGLVYRGPALIGEILRALPQP